MSCRTAEYDAIVAGITRAHTEAVWYVLRVCTCEEEAISQTEVAKIATSKMNKRRFDTTKITTRTVRLVCDDLCDAGVPVCATDAGMFLGNSDDLIEYARYLRSGAFSLLKKANKKLRLANKLADTPEQAETAQREGRFIDSQIDMFGKETTK